jgi:DDE superfamily endonuclease
MDNGRTLGFRGDNTVKYADVVSGGMGMTMVVRITGGPRAMICPPFMIFQNENCSYPIRGVPDNVSGVSYRTAKKGFMTRDVWLQWLKERRAQHRYDNSACPRVIYVDNVSSHDTTSEETKAQLNKMNTSIRFLVANVTDKIQPCDSYVISKIKDRWTELWEAYKLEAIQKGEWQEVSGALKNPGKTFFLKLAARAVADVNKCRDKNGLTFARKAMIRCGLSLDVTGQWHVNQLTPELQAIVAKHINHFNGEAVPEKK